MTYILVNTVHPSCVQHKFLLIYVRKQPYFREMLVLKTKCFPAWKTRQNTVALSSINTCSILSEEIAHKITCIILTINRYVYSQLSKIPFESLIITHNAETSLWVVIEVHALLPFSCPLLYHSMFSRFTTYILSTLIF